MAEKSFGIKELNLIGASGTPSIDSPNNLNLNAVNVAISTNVSIGGTLSVTGNVSIGGTLTYEDVTNIDSVGIVTAREGIKLPDDKEITFGADGDGFVKADGSGNFLIQGGGGGTGTTYVRGRTLRLSANGGSGGYNGAVTIDKSGDERVQLKYGSGTKLVTTSSGVTVTGTLTATTFSGSGASLTSLPAANLTGTLPAISGANLTNLPADTPTNSDIQVVYTVTANGTSAYRFAGNGVVSTADNPALYLIRGQKYRFINNSGGSHPFQIREASGGTAYSTGVTNNGASSGNIDFAPTFDSPAQLVYQCTSHGGMVGNIYLRDAAGNNTNVGVTTFSGAATLGNGSGLNWGNTSARIRGESGASGLLRFDTNGGERVRITSTGQLLVGTTSSSYKFHVDSTSLSAEISVDNDASNYKVALNTTNSVNADFNIQHKTNLTSIGTGVNVPLCFHINGSTNANSAEKMRLDTAGTLHVKGGNIEAGDDSFPLDFLDSISNYIGVAADGGSNNGDALFIAHSHGSGLAFFGYEAGGDRLVIGTDAGNGQNYIDFLTDVGGTSGGNTDNLNGKVAKMRIDPNGHLLHGVLTDEDTSGSGGLRFINSGDIVLDGDQKALVFRSTNSTAQLQSGVEWWNENGAGVQAKIVCDRTAVSNAPSDLVFYTTTNVDTSANNSEGDITEHLRITSVGKIQRRSLGTQTNPARSAQHLYDNGITTDGNYYLQSSSMTAPALVRCVFHDNRGWMILLQHACIDNEGLPLTLLQNKVGSPNLTSSDFQGCAQTDGLNLTPLNMWDAFGTNGEDSLMAMYAREVQYSGGSYDETQTYSSYTGGVIWNQTNFQRLFSGNFSNGQFRTGIRVTYNSGSNTVYSKKGTTWSSPSLATINNGNVDQDLWFCNGADGGDTNWCFGLMKGGTPYPRLANASNGGGRNSISRWAIIGICEI